MGQYHVAVNVDRSETMSGHDLGTGAKMWEIAMSECGISKVLPLLLLSDKVLLESESIVGLQGLWANDRITMVGDYAEPDDHDTINFHDLYEQACDFSSPLPISALNYSEDIHPTLDPENKGNTWLNTLDREKVIYAVAELENGATEYFMFRSLFDALAIGRLGIGNILVPLLAGAPDRRGGGDMADVEGVEPMTGRWRLARVTITDEEPVGSVDIGQPVEDYFRWWEEN